MSDTIQCPSCRRRLPLRGEMLGRRVRCPICEVAFVAGLTPDAATPAPDATVSTSAAPATPPAQADALLWPYTSAPPPARRSAPAGRLVSPSPQPQPIVSPGDDFPRGVAPPYREPYDIFAHVPQSDPTPERGGAMAVEVATDRLEVPGSWTPPSHIAPSPRRNLGSPRERSPRDTTTPNEWSHARTIAFRSGLGMIVFGVGSVLLPRFGYQFAKINQLGEAAPIAGVLVGIPGLVISGGCLLPRRARLRVLMVVLFALFGITIALTLLFAERPNRASSSPSSSSSASSVPPRSRAPSTRDLETKRLADEMESFRLSTNALEGRFGADKVVRVQGIMTGGVVQRAAFRDRVEKVLRDAGAQDVRIVHRGTLFQAVAAPIADLHAVAARLDLGPEKVIDADQRAIGFIQQRPPTTRSGG